MRSNLRSTAGRRIGLALSLYLQLLVWAPADGAPYPLSVRSRSGQFVVHGNAPADSTLLQPAVRSGDLLELTPAILVVTAERIKAAVLKELGLADEFKGKIYLSIEPSPRSPAQVLIASTLSPDGWRYDIRLPGSIESIKLVRAIVTVLLQELVDRSGGGRAVEVPLWLKEGMAYHLVNYAALNLTLQTESLLVREARKEDAFIALRAHLGERPALTFHELSFPSADQISPGQLEFYDECAQLFLFHLLQLNGGRKALVQTIHSLPQYLNWQFAFLEGFRLQFHDLLELEKWWALSVLHFTARNEAQHWSIQASIEKLGDLLKVYPTLKEDAVAPGRHLSLREIASDWGLREQKELFQNKITELSLLRANVPKPVVPLVDGYLVALQRYVGRREGAGFASSRPGHYYGSVAVVIERLKKDLDELDARRVRLAASVVTQK